MSALRLELEIDGEVYPELFAALASLSHPASRGERLRQLAAAGLIWERVRVHGASLAGPRPQASVPQERAETAVEERPADAEDPPPVLTPKRPAERPFDDDFIDLALDAPPARRFDPAALHAVPVLLDVVGGWPDADPAEEQFASGSPVRSPAPSSDDAGEPQLEADSEASATVMLMHRSAAPRTRLIRMKERGLFKNG